MSYKILRGHWCDTVLNVHAPIDDKDDDLKGSLYKVLEPIFDHFPKYYMKILFSAKIGREDIFKPTVRIFREEYMSYGGLLPVMPPT